MRRPRHAIYTGLSRAPVCTPTRASLLLGQHTGHTSLRSNRGHDPIRTDDVTISRILNDAGYATAGFGKWGCGGRSTSVRAFAPHPFAEPT
ncbi:MAG: sulfatase-like hydrolase/transferase [Phycisphaerales bacterium]|nr:sulfatase-like hydrolase/transferase [Phycisphaerales bacterium]